MILNDEMVMNVWVPYKAEEFLPYLKNLWPVKRESVRIN
jgi:hypothetical protein